MNYTFTLIALNRVITGNVDVSFDLTECPFGGNLYRINGSSKASTATLDAFWLCIDEVLTQNNMSSADFKRAVKAESGSLKFGDVTFDAGRPLI
jgi:hypothetical protein